MLGSYFPYLEIAGKNRALLPNKGIITHFSTNIFECKICWQRSLLKRHYLSPVRSLLTVKCFMMYVSVRHWLVHLWRSFRFFVMVWATGNKIISAGDEKFILFFSWFCDIFFVVDRQTGRACEFSLRHSIKTSKDI